MQFGKPETAEGVLDSVLTNEAVFGLDLVRAGLADKISAFFAEMIAGPGAVRATLKKHL